MGPEETRRNLPEPTPAKLDFSLFANPFRVNNHKSTACDRLRFLIVEYVTEKTIGVLYNVRHAHD